MPATYRRSAFLFGHDLRLHDNTALQRALDHSEEVIACVVHDPHDASVSRDNKKALQFELESIAELERAIQAHGGRLYRYVGGGAAVVERLVRDAEVEAVFVNRDCSPRAREHDAALEAACARNGAYFGRTHDTLLHPPGTVLDDASNPCDDLGAFRERAAVLEVRAPAPFAGGTFFAAPLEDDRPIFPDDHQREDRELYVRGGRSNALAVLDGLDEFEDYDDVREQPALDATTGLSAHLRYGTCSVREVWHAVRRSFGVGHGLEQSLLLRDFYLHLAWTRPWLVAGEVTIGTATDDGRFRAWCEGRTGVPLIDAAMRQLVESGFLNDRLRQVVAGFLVARLRVDWRLGLQFFGRELTDADPSLNEGNWRAVQAKPRVGLDPWAEQRRLDPDARYIHEWVPELSHLDAAAIHGLEDVRPERLAYPSPIVPSLRRAEAAPEATAEQPPPPSP